MQPSIPFPDQQELTPEIPPTWGEGAGVFHTTEKCTRFQALDPRRRKTSRVPPSGLRHCFNCEDIVRAKRRG